MSRIYYHEPDDLYGDLAAWRWEWNTSQHLRGKKGQKVLRELEAALLALPEKRLATGAFFICDGFDEEVVGHGAKPGDVCPLACLALKRKLDQGKTREAALAEIDLEIGADASGDEAVDASSQALGITRYMAFAVMEENDEFAGSLTPEQRYVAMLAWVRRLLKHPSGAGGGG